MHPNAKIAAEMWARTAAGEEKPWLELEWEEKMGAGWYPWKSENPPVFTGRSQYRWRQKMTWIEGPGGRYEYPKPETAAPEYGIKYYTPDCVEALENFWTDAQFDRIQLDCGFVHLNKENALQQAIAMRKAMNGEKPKGYWRRIKTEDGGPYSKPLPGEVKEGQEVFIGCGGVACVYEYGMGADGPPPDIEGAP